MKRSSCASGSGYVPSCSMGFCVAMTKNGSGRRCVVLAGRHLAFLHRFEQSGLGFRRRAVDLVGEDDVGEDRAVDEAELAPAAALVQHHRAGDVRRHQIRGELNALETDVENLADRGNHEGLGETRHADQQTVAAREDGGEDLLDHFVLPDNDARNCSVIWVRYWANCVRYSLILSVDTRDFPSTAAACGLAFALSRKRRVQWLSYCNGAL